MTIAEKLIEALKTTLLGMGIVMVTLYVLSLILDLMRYFFYRPISEVKKNELTNQFSSDIDNTKNDINDSQENDLELVAVITAALSSYLSVPTQKIKISSIRQIHKTTPVWGMASRYDVSKNKF